MAIDRETWRRLTGNRPVTEETRRLAVQQHVSRGGVLEPAAHDLRRHEPPKPWSVRLAERRAASGETAAVPQVLRDSDGVPKPWSSALAARNRSEGR